MFIMTNINPSQNSITIYDTNDGTKERVKLDNVLYKVYNNEVQVAGLNSVPTYQDSRQMGGTGIWASILEARYFLANLFVQNGMSQVDAMRKAGLQ